ncbi:MerR family transcriptional regulator [Hippea maritima]|uniref:Transcriptional regulator, MerR family n=1 Tax=Hippea maritima (strain ATCC 700847 / DSM 10411 / MH2) TaxID=760142 RepID=F2LWB3_HIPMA|nr:helix-turn-helix transcriptional regulator [Hippea maritima]AEA34047.1 transcriptional regulator, MerR family [Hippea maritima DSM 10411]
MGRKKGFYTIGMVAEILNIHPHTLREYEREGLIRPKRTAGNIRIYTDEDIEDIKFIREMTQELGVNLAGVDIIMRMKRQIEQLHSVIESLESTLRKKIEEENARRSSLVKKEPSHIVEIKIERDD